MMEEDVSLLSTPFDKATSPISSAQQPTIRTEECVKTYVSRLNHHADRLKSNATSREYLRSHTNAITKKTIIPHPCEHLQVNGVYFTIDALAYFSVAFQFGAILAFLARCLLTPRGLTSPNEVKAEFIEIFIDPVLVPLPTSDDLTPTYKYVKGRSPLKPDITSGTITVGHCTELKHFNFYLTEDPLYVLHPHNQMLIHVDDNYGKQIRIRLDQIHRYMKWRAFCISLGFNKELYPKYEWDDKGNYHYLIYNPKTQLWKDHADYMIVYDDECNAVYTGQNYDLFIITLYIAY